LIHAINRDQSITREGGVSHNDVNGIIGIEEEFSTRGGVRVGFSERKGLGSGAITPNNVNVQPGYWARERERSIPSIKCSSGGVIQLELFPVGTGRLIVDEFEGLEGEGALSGVRLGALALHSDTQFGTLLVEEFAGSPNFIPVV
jgi:hypothetical protein